MGTTRVVKAGDRTVTIENEGGDRFDFLFPSHSVSDIRLTSDPAWHRVRSNAMSLALIHLARATAIPHARAQGWL